MACIFDTSARSNTRYRKSGSRVLLSVVSRYSEKLFKAQESFNDIPAQNVSPAVKRAKLAQLGKDFGTLTDGEVQAVASRTCCNSRARPMVAMMSLMT